jgi:hypothetical protein
MHTSAAGMDDPLRNSLVVEVVDLLAEDHVLEQHRAASVRLELVLIVGDGHALVRGQPLDAFSRLLVGLGAGACVALVSACHPEVLSPRCLSNAPVRPNVGAAMPLAQRVERISR